MERFKYDIYLQVLETRGWGWRYTTIPRLLSTGKMISSKLSAIVWSGGKKGKKQCTSPFIRIKWTTGPYLPYQVCKYARVIVNPCPRNELHVLVTCFSMYILKKAWSSCGGAAVFFVTAPCRTFISDMWVHAHTTNCGYTYVSHKKTLVKLKKRMWFKLDVNSKREYDFFNSNHNLFLTLTRTLTVLHLQCGTPAII